MYRRQAIVSAAESFRTLKPSSRARAHTHTHTKIDGLNLASKSNNNEEEEEDEKRKRRDVEEWERMHDWVPYHENDEEANDEEENDEDDGREDDRDEEDGDTQVTYAAAERSDLSRTPDDGYDVRLRLLG